MKLIIRVFMLPFLPFVAWMASGMSNGESSYAECLKLAWKQWWD